MSIIKEFLSTLECQDIKITLNGNQLRVSAPAEALTPELREEMTRRKGEILSALQNFPDIAVPPDNILRVSRETDITPSFAQQRLWVLDKFAPGNPVYNIAEALSLAGALSTPALQNALAEIISRHEVLRTGFIEKNGQPVQVITPHMDFELDVIELKKPGISEFELDQLLVTQARRPFNLQDKSLFRAALYCIDESHHVLLITLHHIIFDGWSFTVFYKELSQLYNAFGSPNKSPLEELDIQYADYSDWQREHLQGDVLESQISYWEKALEDLPAGLDLPNSLPRPAQLSYKGNRVSSTLPAKLRNSLKSFASEQGVTLYMTLLAALQILLYRYTGQADIVLGTPISGRNRVETEPLLGFFVNTLIIRSKIPDDVSFKDYLKHVRDITLGAYANQDLPLEKIVEELQPKRDMSRTPFFQIMFAYQSITADELSINMIDVTRKTLNINTSKFDLTLSIEETENGLDANWEFATDIFEQPTIERMQAHYRILLEAIAKNPDENILKLPLLSKPERELQLNQWNDTYIKYPTEVTLQSMFETQVNKTPQATALIFEQQELSYDELNKRANQLAHHLIGKDIKGDSLVGICLERSVEMVVGLLGILKAGGAYVPMDPDYPRERLDFMLKDSGIGILLTQSHLHDKLPTNNIETLNLDQWDGYKNESTSDPDIDCNASNLAYVIYTSGSTGLPKGVLIPHRGICNRLLWMQDQYKLTLTDRVLQKTSFSFDVSAWEFFWPLITGASLVVARPEGHKDSAYLAEIIKSQQITTLHFVPSMLQVFLEQDLQACTSIKRVICSGEALPYETQKRFFSRLDAELYNLYGPTEASVDVTYWACQKDSTLEIVPIGKPVANTFLYILDRNHEPVPTGVAGELYIGGVQLARGYLNREELTNNTFIPDPFSQQQNAKMYKTGDLVRYLTDGNIEYLGRLDHQLKIRGFRIEPGEIESALRKHDDISEALVIGRVDKHGDKQLVAYCIAENNKSPDTNELHSWLGKTLPDHMIPSAIVKIDAYPLTPNGKVDRMALPKPGASPDDGLKSIEAYKQPGDFLEYQLSEIWDEIFDATWPISVSSNFFSIGGHSLMAVKLIAQIKNILGVDLPLASLFQAPTITELAQLIRDGKQQTSWHPVMPIQSSDKTKPVFLMHLLDGIIFQMHMHIATLLSKHGPVYGIQARGIDGKNEPQTSFQEMADTYLNAIYETQPNGPYRLIGICDGATIVFEMAQQLRAAGREISLLALVVPSDPPTQVKPLQPETIGMSRALKGHPPELKKIIDAQFQARFNYRPEKYDGDVVYIEASDDPAEVSQPIRLAWQELVQGNFEYVTVPGDHNSCVRDPLVNTLTEKLGHYL